MSDFSTTPEASRKRPRGGAAIASGLAAILAIEVLYGCAGDATILETVEQTFGALSFNSGYFPQGYPPLAYDDCSMGASPKAGWSTLRCLASSAADTAACGPKPGAEPCIASVERAFAEGAIDSMARDWAIYHGQCITTSGGKVTSVCPTVCKPLRTPGTANPPGDLPPCSSVCLGDKNGFQMVNGLQKDFFHSGILGSDAALQPTYQPSLRESAYADARASLEARGARVAAVCKDDVEFTVSWRKIKGFTKVEAAGYAKFNFGFYVTPFTDCFTRPTLNCVE